MNLVMLAYIGGGLLVCSYLCWRFPGIRAVLRTWCLILARPLARLTQIATLLTSWCHQVFLKGMSLPQTDDRDNEQIFAKILVRLFHMGIGLVIILAEVPLTSYRSAAFYNLIETKLNLPLSLFTALLWTLLPGVWLYTLADVTILPQWACLFPFVHTHKVARWCIGFVALVLFGASAYLSYPFYQWSQCSILSLTCASDPTIQMFTIPLFGVLLSLAGSVVCLWAILLGVITVVSCMFGLVGLFFLACAYLVFGLAGDTLTSISQPQYIPSYTPVNLPLTAPESYAALPMHTAGNGSGPQKRSFS